MEEAISSGDPEVIKKRRSTIQGSMTTIRKHLEKLLVKRADKFDHENIKSFNVKRDHTDLTFGELHSRSKNLKLQPRLRMKG